MDQQVILRLIFCSMLITLLDTVLNKKELIPLLSNWKSSMRKLTT